LRTIIGNASVLVLKLEKNVLAKVMHKSMDNSGEASWEATHCKFYIEANSYTVNKPYSYYIAAIYVGAMTMYHSIETAEIK